MTPLLHTLDGAAAFVGRAVGRLCRLTRAGGGTTLPGRVAARLSPGLVARRAAALPDGVIVVSGTNGKTTTASMIHAILEGHGLSTVWNRSGANLSGGVTSAFLRAPRQARAAVLEVDEAALPGIVERVRPRVLVLTNVFRDQLDRFAEPERVAALLCEGATQMPPGGTVVVNADDQSLWYTVWRRLAGGERRIVGFGVRSPQGPSATGAAAAAEPAPCPACGAELVDVRRTLAHLGQARCSACGWRSERPEVAVRVVAEAGLRGIVFDTGDDPVTLPVGGLHNVYNAAASLAAVRTFGVPAGQAIAALERYRARFGRSERLHLGERRVWLGLIKNPAGAGALLRAVAEDRAVGAVVVSVNDLDADGRDVSWIWDADFDRLAGMGVPVVASGRRAEDVALRLKYGGVAPLPARRDPLAAIQAATVRCPHDRTVVVLATYTAMLATRRALLHGRAARVDDIPA
jgi:UDP-N-acetylmuramyl tripeptide synthase